MGCSFTLVSVLRPSLHRDSFTYLRVLQTGLCSEHIQWGCRLTAPLCIRADFGRGRGAEGAVVNLHFRPSTASPRTPSCSIRVRHDVIRSGWRRRGWAAGRPPSSEVRKSGEWRASRDLDCPFHVSNVSKTVRLSDMQADLETHTCFGPRCTVMPHHFPSIPVNVPSFWRSDASFIRSPAGIKRSREYCVRI